MLLTVQDSINWIRLTNGKVQENREYLTTLDQAIGDGDHGINMSRGFNEVMSKVHVSEYETVAEVFKDVAMTLISKVGGASGPLYGTAFLKMSTALKGNGKEVDFTSFTNAIDEGLKGIVMRGKAKEGDKTMIDVWAPVLKLLKESEEVDPEQLAVTAKVAVEATKHIKATKGRAAYLGDRSIEHIDPGAMSSYYLFEALAEVLST
ncbi:dihydroxyacetone kinase subunit DhaL [Aquibacillus saliphilus]|uniref:dihydroxyacetone kinase subunit DhaL n=1 Tax=Aquibacillus saliphilus TaxID=1909422 RepID=UPI001CEFC637|nr:dihydroxyacetone kinase subunit DhaL [Aquibacillus saliphilus]